MKGITDQYPRRERDSPFGEIAISLSGGGYRAAAFHLGTLDLLHRLDLLKYVGVLSTVSGGTFPGMMYAVSLAESVEFKTFFDKVYNFLLTTHVIRLALNNLENQQIDGVKQMPSLIKGAASVYASDAMVGNKQFALFDSARHFRRLTFNSTEFHGGNSFRFQTSGYFGNGNLRVPESVAAKTRLADIAAASSCFPSAFEPLRFPDDFNWPSGDTVATIRAELGNDFREPIPLMDGGIYDNQGIDSVEQAYRAEDAKDALGLFIISDTSPRRENLFAFPVTRRKYGLSLGTLVLLAWVLFFLALITSISLFAIGLDAYLTSTVSWPVALFVYVIPLIFSLSIVIALPFVRRRFLDSLKLVQEKTELNLWQNLKKLSTSDLLALIDSRIKSLIALTSSVFMERVRDLGFRDIFVYPKYNKKVVPNLIYDLNDTKRFGKEIRNRQLVPTPQLQQIAKAAESVPTNLWFTSEETLKELIVCGQATTCFNVLRYIAEYKAADLKDATADIEPPRSSDLLLPHVSVFSLRRVGPTPPRA